jgi:hypothetical protein
MTGAMPADDPSLFDELVEQTDNSAEPGQPDPPQSPDWRPWADPAAAG